MDGDVAFRVRGVLSPRQERRAAKDDDEVRGADDASIHNTPVLRNDPHPSARVFDADAAVPPQQPIAPVAEASDAVDPVDLHVSSARESRLAPLRPPHPHASMLKAGAGALLAGGAAYGVYQYTQPKKDALKMIISGGPGSGKGTQCDLLVTKYGVKHISTGDALRHHVKTGTDLGKEAKAYMERGDLVPDSLVIGICKAEMETSEAKTNGWLLDGMPRTKAQCDALETMGLVPNLFLRLDVPDEVMMERACGRRQDPVTRQIYHIKYKKAPTEEIEKRLIIRSDDTVEKMTNRIAQYHKNMSAVSGSYTEKLVVVDGNRKPTDVFPVVCDAIDKALAK